MKNLLSFDETSIAVQGMLLKNHTKARGFSSVSIDSRTVKDGSLFVPLRGEKQDGHRYIRSALEKGAVLFFADEKFLSVDSNKIKTEKLCDEFSASCIQVKNTLAALQAAARFYLKKFPNLIKVGITGSSGKTTTKEIAGAVLSQKFSVVMNKGNLNSETGLPLSVFEVRDEHEVGIFELGMNRKGEMKEITSVLCPQFGIITNIGSAHIGILGSQQAIAEEKKQIFSFFDKDCMGFVPDCPFTDFLQAVPLGKVVCYENTTLKNIKKIESKGMYGSTIFYKDEEICFPLAGNHNIKNAQAVIALAEELGLSVKEIKRGLESVQPIFGRSQFMQGDVDCLFDCYNANPDSMSAALAVFSETKVQGKKAAVLGSMLELGKESAAAHKKICAQAAASDIDFIYLFGKEIGDSRKNINWNGKTVFYFDESEMDALGKALDENLHRGDFVLLKASRGLALERLEPVLRRAR
ncbi:MAG: UDP-N-acetylmuramoyl-tripeptide--D-alanyl-D-alanine ligase [Treponema phagedenis]